MRYYVVNYDGIPLHAQPANGYTKLQAIERCQRECEEASKIFGGSVSSYTRYFHVADENFKIIKDLDTAI